MTYTDLGEQIVQAAQSIDLFQKTEEEVKVMKEAMVGYFDKRGFEACEPCDVMQLFQSPCDCIEQGQEVAKNMPQKTIEVFNKREILFNTKELVVYWIRCDIAYDKFGIQKLMDLEGKKHGSAAVLFVTHHAVPNNAGIASIGFRIAQAGNFGPWDKKVLEQVDHDYEAADRCSLLNVATVADLVGKEKSLGFVDGGGHPLAARAQYNAAVRSDTHTIKRTVLKHTWSTFDSNVEEIQAFKKQRTHLN